MSDERPRILSPCSRKLTLGGFTWGEGFSSLFTYCTRILHLSEHAAYNRIETARAARRFPIVIDLVAEGAVTLTAIRLLAPHLTSANHHDVLERARHKSKRDIELLVATFHPRPDVPTSVRKLPTPVTVTRSEPADTVARVAAADAEQTMVAEPQPVPGAVGSPALPSGATQKRTAELTPLAPERYKIQFTVGRDTYDKLRRAQDLLRHVVPNGDPAVIFDRALALLIAELERKKIGTTDRPRMSRRTKAASRHIPAAVRRSVWRRDGGRCAFVGATGRCTETGFLEYHHVVPYATGGETSIENLELRCRAHNQHEARCYFGAAMPMLRELRPAYGVRTRSGTS